MSTVTDTSQAIRKAAEFAPASDVPDARPIVCHVLHTLHVGGGEVLARAFAIEHEAQWKPVFALLDDLGGLGRELRDRGYAVEVIGRRPGFDLGCARRLRRFLRREGVSLVHAHQYAPLFYSAVARLPLGGIPILFTEHGRDFPDYRRWKRVWANRVLLGRRDRFVAVGECVRRALVDFEGLPADRVEVIYNGRDLSAYDPQRRQRASVRRELGLAEDSPVVMQVARLNRLKDIPTALRAMRRLRETVPAARLVLVGDGEERGEVERLIDELELRDCVSLLGVRDDVPRLLQAADVFLLTSVTEGIPLTLIEAMATGLPCAATRVGGVAEVVVEEETGLLAEAGDGDGLARCLTRLLEDAGMREAMGRRGLERVHAQFDNGPMHEGYRRLYEQMTSRGPNRRRGGGEPA